MDDSYAEDFKLVNDKLTILFSEFKQSRSFVTLKRLHPSACWSRSFPGTLSLIQLNLLCYEHLSSNFILIPDC
jgi:hypothetical protein